MVEICLVVVELVELRCLSSVNQYVEAHLYAAVTIGAGGTATQSGHPGLLQIQGGPSYIL